MKQKQTTYSFPEGIPAFEDTKEMTLIERPDMLPLVILKHDDLTFVCVSFKAWSIDYDPEILPADLKMLGVTSRQDVELYNLLTIGHSDIKDTTANLMAPIALNPKNHVGKQVMCKGEFPVRFNIWSDMQYVLPMLLPIAFDVMEGNKP